MGMRTLIIWIGKKRFSSNSIAYHSDINTLLSLSWYKCSHSHGFKYKDGIYAGIYINKFGPDCYPSDKSNKHKPKIFETWNDAKKPKIISKYSTFL